MRTGHVTLVAVATIQLFGWVLPVNSGEAKRERKYERTISFGFAQADLHHVPITILASLTAEDFFDHLERVRTEHGIEFRKRSKVVNEFPDTITVTIRVSCPRCYIESTDKDEIKTEIGEMESLRFDASWERGSESREVTQLSVSGSSKYFSAFYHDWTYELSIPSRNIPLTYALNISVFAQDGKKLAVFKAAL